MDKYIYQTKKRIQPLNPNTNRFYACMTSVWHLGSENLCCKAHIYNHNSTRFNFINSMQQSTTTYLDIKSDNSTRLLSHEVSKDLEISTWIRIRERRSGQLQRREISMEILSSSQKYKTMVTSSNNHSYRVATNCE